MYAVMETGGKQYRVTAGDTFEIEKLELEPGAIATFEIGRASCRERV